MGTLYNLGITEENIGDIIVFEDGKCQFMVNKEFNDHIKLVVNSIGSAKVKLENIEALTIEKKEITI